MNTVIALFVIVTISISLLGWVAVSGNKRVSLKLLAYACVITVLATIWLGLSELLSRSKPMSLVWFESAEQADVVATKMIEDQAIYVWLNLPNEAEPRSYRLPWTDAAAKSLHQAQQQAENEGTQVRMQTPFNMSANRDQPLFYAAPQLAPPPKSVVFDKPLDVTASTTN